MWHDMTRWLFRGKADIFKALVCGSLAEQPQHNSSIYWCNTWTTTGGNMKCWNSVKYSCYTCLKILYLPVSWASICLEEVNMLSNMTSESFRWILICFYRSPFAPTQRTTSPTMHCPCLPAQACHLAAWRLSVCVYVSIGSKSRAHTHTHAAYRYSLSED